MVMSRFFCWLPRHFETLQNRKVLVGLVRLWCSSRKTAVVVVVVVAAVVGVSLLFCVDLFRGCSPLRFD